MKIFKKRSVLFTFFVFQYAEICFRFSSVSTMKAGCPSKSANQAYSSSTLSMLVSYFSLQCFKFLHDTCGSHIMSARFSNFWPPSLLSYVSNRVPQHADIRFYPWTPDFEKSEFEHQKHTFMSLHNIPLWKFHKSTNSWYSPPTGISRCKRRKLGPYYKERPFQGQRTKF